MQNKTKIIFFSESNQLSDNLSALEVDQFFFRKPKLITDIKNLELLDDMITHLLFYVSREFNVDQRILLKKLTSINTNTSVVLCSVDQNALTAWNFDLFHFLPLPLYQSGIQKTLNKHIRFQNLSKKDKIKLKYNGGYYTINPNNLLYCRADGNYTNIYLKSGKRLIVTAQLHKIQQMLAGTKGIERVGKSYIFNLLNIQQIGKGKIIFNNLPSTIIEKVSSHYLRKLKSYLTGI